MERPGTAESSTLAAARANQPVDLDGLIGVDGPLVFCREKLLRCAPESGLVLACKDLADPARFETVIARYMRKFPGSDRRAVVSMWTLYYFSTLTIAPSVHLFLHRLRVPLDLATSSLVCDAETGEPQAFVFQGEVQPSAKPEDDLHRLLTGHVEPLVAAIAAGAGVAPKLLWNNVAAYLSWILKEIAFRHESIAMEAGLALVQDALWPDGRKNPMHGMMRVARQQCGMEFVQRKVCCLRYNLPGVGGCGESCPLPDGRK